MRRSQAGFSLIEILIAAALFVLVSLGAFEGIRQLSASGRHLAARALAYAALERFTAQLRADARGATAIWPQTVNTGAHDDCVEIDFYGADSSGPAFWAYRRYPHHTAADTIPGDAVARVAGASAIAPCAGGGTIVVSAVRAFAASSATTLAAHADAYTGQPDSAFVAPGAPQTPPFDLGVLSADGATPVRGGNTLVEVLAETDDAARVVDLVPGAVPSGYTQVLRYTCDARCGVGHAGTAPQTLTTCAVTWQLGWRYAYQVYPAPGAAVLAPSTLGYFYAGWFTFTYGDDKYGQPDALVKVYAASNYDPARDYGAVPPVVAPQPGDLTAQDTPDAIAATWYGAFAPYVAASYGAPLAREFQTCSALQSSTTASYVQNV